uniref:Uncharacterized protein n=1 Tax=Megaselia scalaris TaxID=36166 RepID=T1GP28_MEGSC
MFLHKPECISKGRMEDGKKRWSDVISLDSRAIGILNWHTTAKNREVWKWNLIEGSSSLDINIMYYE